MTKFIGCFVLLANLYAATAAAQDPQQKISPSPEMQRLFAAQLGRWSQREERADGSTGQGEAVWQPGPGGMSLVENEYIRNAAGEMTGLSVTWWDDAAKGYRALWCSNRTENGCIVMAKTARWEGKQFVLGDEFERDGKKFLYREVESEITPTAYTLTSYIGEPGSELKPTSTIHASRIPEVNTESPGAAETMLVALANEWTEAINRKDREKLDELMAPEYALYAWNGKLLGSRPQWLDNLFSHITIEKNTLTDISPRVYGDLAIVTSKAD
jgi:uncharacterized protein DUF4440